MASRAGAGGGLEENMWQAIFVGSTQRIAYGAAAILSNAFSAKINIIRVVATTDCLIEIGASPTATTNSMKLIAGLPEYFCVDPGHFLSVLRDKSNGELHITEGLTVTVPT